MEMNFIYGKNAVIEALSSMNREINKILILRTNHGDKKIEQIKQLAQNRGIVYQFAGKDKFVEYEGTSHQGVVALISPVNYVDLDDFLENENYEEASVVVLDGIEDVHNLGAIIRTAVCAGVKGIIIPSRRSVQVNSTVEKVSAGAVNRIPIIKVNSIQTAIEKLKKSNWWVVAAEASAKDNYYDIDYTGMNFALVMGAEHAGVSKTVMNAADFKVKIPMITDFNSLNVSNAFSAIIFESVRQKLSKVKK